MEYINSEIKVSVIVPVYNVERYLRKSIQSIISQTIKEIEIILINDGSTDSSLLIMEELAREDSRIKILSQPNHGQSIARNIGLVNSIGKYIYFFDSDDLLEEKALEECYNKCEQNQLDFLFFDADVFSDDNISMSFTSYERTNKFVDKIYGGFELLEEQLATNSFSASVCLTFIKKKYIDSLNLFFYPRIIHEDELFAFILYLKAKRIGLLNKIYFHRRLRPNSTMTTTFGYKNIIGYVTVCRELKKTLAISEISVKEEYLIKKRIKELLMALMYKIDVNIKEEGRFLNNIIKNEFISYCNINLRLKLCFPFLYHFLKTVKSYISIR